MSDNYSIKQSRVTGVNITQGAFELNGFGDGEAITITATDDAFDSAQGADGRAVAFDTQKDQYDLEVTLLSTSPSNTILTTLYNLNKTRLPSL